MSEKTASRWVVDRRRQLAGEPDPKDGDRGLREAGKRIRELEMENAFLKKAAAFFAKEQQGPWRSTGWCRRRGPDPRWSWWRGSPGVGRSGPCSWLGRGCPEDDRSDAREAVRRVRPGSDGRFGSRFVKCSLPEGHSRPTLYRVRKLMRELGIRGCTPNKGKRTTIPGRNADPGPDLVRRDFTSPIPTWKPAGDIDRLRTGGGWIFLSTVIDPSTRMVVGWSPSDRMTADIAVDSLSMAKAGGYVAGNAIFHADRGAQHASRLLAEWAKAHGVRLSCSRTGNCHDNAVAESLFATLENEMYYRESSATRADARHAVVEFIESHCNRCRPHSSIGYRIPGLAMEDFFRRTAPGPESLPIAA